MNWNGIANQCAAAWLSSSSFNSNATDQSNWSTGCNAGFSYGHDTVLASALAQVGKSIGDIQTLCGAINTDNGFKTGCTTGYVGRLNGYQQTDGLVCGSLTLPFETSGCSQGYQQASTDIAAGPGPSGSVTPTPPSGSVTPSTPGHIPNTVSDVINLIKRLTNWMFTFFLLAAVIMVIYAAFIYLTSGGGEEVGKAHKMLLYAAVAIAVATLSQGIVTVVQKLVTG
jgi:hypothetical protein